MMSKFIYIKKGLESKGEFVDRAEWNEDFTSNDDWYASTYYYEQDALDYFKTKGKIKGFKNVKTDKIWFDFDSTDLEKSKKDAKEVIKRLKENGIKESAIDIYFSGNKGYTVEANVDKMLNRTQVEYLACEVFGKDLETFDSTMYDENQIFRVPNTKHPKSGLYKVQLTLNQLNLPTEKIKEYAKSPKSIKPRENGQLVPTLYEIKQSVVQPQNKTSELNFDISRRPPHWKDYKWALLNAYKVKENERTSSIMVIAATCKGLGYDRTLAEAMCNAFDDKFCANTGKPQYEDMERSLDSIFNDDWNGGQYSFKNNKWLQEYCKRIDITVNTATDELTVEIDNVFDLFKDYAKNIDRLTIQTGIPSIDKKCRMTIGMVVGIVAAPGVGKCLGKDTDVLMYDGSVKKVQDIKKDDLLMGDDSSPRTVLSTCSGTEQLYKVKQQYNMDYVVNESHILSLKGSASFRNKKSVKYTKYGNVIDIGVRDYLNKSKKFKQYMKGYRVPIELNENHTPLDPYFLGYWLGDGTTSKPEITFGKQDSKYIEWFKNYVTTTGGDYSVYSDKNCIRLSCTKGDNKKNYIKENLPETKIIDQNYLINTRKSRLRLLAGLLDSDGHYIKNRNAYEFTLKSKELITQIENLCNLLGFRTTLTEVNKYCMYKGEKREGVYHRLYICGNKLTDIPCKIERKKATGNKQQKHFDVDKIELEKLEVGEYFGFEIDGNKRFVLKDGTVTHNTSISLQVLNNMSKKNEQSIFFSYDMYNALVLQKLIQKHFKDQPDFIFEKFKSGDLAYEEKVRTKLKEEYKNVEFCFEAGQTPDDIEQTIKHTKDKTGKDVRLIVVDYNELVLSDISDPTQSSAYVVQKLRKIASNHNCCVVVLFQPNKLAGGPAEELKSYRSAKGSSAIEQAVSIMIGLSRPGYNPREPKNDVFMTVSCLKNRMGQLFSEDLYWNGLTGTVGELTPAQRSLLKEIQDEKNTVKNSDDDSW